MELYLDKEGDERSLYCILPETEQGYENLYDLLPEEPPLEMNPVKDKKA